jgi:hypothetical protein
MGHHGAWQRTPPGTTQLLNNKSSAIALCLADGGILGPATAQVNARHSVTRQRMRLFRKHESIDCRNRAKNDYLESCCPQHHSYMERAKKLSAAAPPNTFILKTVNSTHWPKILIPAAREVSVAAGKSIPEVAEQARSGGVRPPFLFSDPG